MQVPALAHLAITLSKEGHQVIAGIREVAGRNKAVAEVLSDYPNITVAEIDILNDHSVHEAFKNVFAKYGHLDVLVNNAAVTGYGLLEAYSIDRIKEMSEVNLYGVIRTYQAVLPEMRRAGKGLIINITSGASGHTFPFMIPYFASKFGVESITEGMQGELTQFGIENVSIQPGVYPTEMNNGTKQGISSDKPKITQQYNPIGSELLNAMGTGMLGRMQQFKMDPQLIADGVLALINMKEGTRPLHFPLDAIAEGTDAEFINTRAEIKSRWLKTYTVCKSRTQQRQNPKRKI